MLHGGLGWGRRRFVLNLRVVWAQLTPCGVISKDRRTLPAPTDTVSNATDPEATTPQLCPKQCHVVDVL